MEGINAIYTGKLVSLSEQELVDCDLTRDHGCQGSPLPLHFLPLNHVLVPWPCGGLQTGEMLSLSTRMKSVDNVHSSLPQKFCILCLLGFP